VGAGLLLRLGLFAIAWGHPQRFVLIDSRDYLGVGQHFSQAVVHGNGPYANLSVFRPPGYPAFIALVRLFAHSIRVLLLAQILLTAATTLLVYRVTKLLFGETPALVAAAIAAIDPVSIIYSSFVLSESLFTVFLLLATWLWLEAVRKRHLLLGAAAGISYAAAAFTRPIALYLLVVLIPLSLLFPRKVGWFRAALAAVVTIGFLVPVGAWMIRNHEVTGSVVFASNAGYTLLYHTAAGALAYQDHIPLVAAQSRVAAEEQAALHGDTNEGNRNRVDTRIAVRILLHHPLGTGVGAVRGAIRMLIGPGQASLDQLLSGPSNGRRLGRAFVPIEVVLLALILLGAILGVWRAWTSPARRNLAVPITLIAYFLILSAGPEAYGRFRVPVLPFIAALSGVGWYWAVLQRRAAKPSPIEPAPLS
jgi:4-amino-4-deoxy-L-arabinose transferase-like glycosyltransferase